MYANFVELRKSEVQLRRIYLPGSSVNSPSWVRFTADSSAFASLQVGIVGREQPLWSRRRRGQASSVVSSNTLATVYRSNRCDHRCTLAQLTSPPLTFS